MLNTTDGPVPKGPHPAHTLNTTRILEEDMVVEGEDELLAVVSAGGWYAEIQDGTLLPLVAWTVMDTGKTYGVVVGEDGLVDATNSVEQRNDFVRYTNEVKEK